MQLKTPLIKNNSSSIADSTINAILGLDYSSQSSGHWSYGKDSYLHYENDKTIQHLRIEDLRICPSPELKQLTLVETQTCASIMFQMIYN